MTQDRPRSTGAEEVHWDLTDLYSDRQGLEAELKKAEAAAGQFSGQYRGRIASLDAEKIAEALGQFEALQESLSRAHSYAHLNWCTGTDCPERGALLQKIREDYTRIQQTLLFFELEWAALEEETAQLLLDSPPLASLRHYLEMLRLRRPHLLAESEEKLLAEKSLTGWQSWNRLFDETVGAIRFELDGTKLTEQEVLSRLYSSQRKVREKAAASLTEGLERNLRPLTFIFNTILADKYSDDRLRSYPHWLSSRNLSNEVSAESVETLIHAVTDRYDLVARHFNLKRRLLGLETLYDYDRYAPLEETEIVYPWEQAKQMTLEAYHAFHPRVGSIAAEFFDQGWIDAPPAPGKVGGAFSHSCVPGAHPFVLLNYTGNIRDVQTLAHELGHGVHQYLSRPQGILQAHTPLTLAEMASTFGEMLVFDRLVEAQKDDAAILALLVNKIDDITATVFRQITLNRFEDRIHTARREQGELSPEQFNDLWMETQRAMFQGSVTLGDHYRIWWSYIPHFVHTPGYVYAYAFGELLVLAMYTRYQTVGEAFAEQYLGLLEKGGSDWPHVLVGKLGIDLNDPDFWLEGLSGIEKLVSKAEALAESLPPVST